MRIRQSLIFLLVLLAGSCFASDRDAGVLMQADRDFAKATAEKGADGWVSYMAADAVLLGDKPVVGADQIKTVMTSVFGGGVILKWEPTKAEFVGNAGNLGYTIGRYEKTARSKAGSTTMEKGTYMTTWQKQKDGTWKVVGDIGAPDKSQ